MNWLRILAPLLKRAAPWLARKLFPDPEPQDSESARHGAAAGEAARRESKLAGPDGGSK